MNPLNTFSTYPPGMFRAYERIRSAVTPDTVMLHEFETWLVDESGVDLTPYGATPNMGMLFEVYRTMYASYIFQRDTNKLADTMFNNNKQLQDLTHSIIEAAQALNASYNMLPD